MGRAFEYLTTTSYALGWGDNRDTSSSAQGGDQEDKAMQLAADTVDRMRRDGAASPIRSVRVRRWGDWDRDKLAYRCPPLFEASYYDAEQGLTDDEAYAARVHDWHEGADRMDANQARNNSKWRTGYRPWSDDWGPHPALCPACGDTLRQGV